MSVSGVSTILTQSQYPLVINGYLCFSAEDVKAARKLVNPRAAEEPAQTAAATDDAAAVRQIRQRQEETVTPIQGDDQARDFRWPRKEEERGQIIDILV